MLLMRLWECLKYYEVDNIVITQKDIDEAEFCVGEVLEVRVATASTEVVLNSRYIGAADGKLDIYVSRDANFGREIGFDELGRKVVTLDSTAIKQYNKQSRNYDEIARVRYSHEFKSIKGDLLGVSMVVDIGDSQLLVGKLSSIEGPVRRGVRINSLSDLNCAIQLFRGIRSTSAVDIVGRPGIWLSPLFEVDEEFEGALEPREKEEIVRENNSAFFDRVASEFEKKSDHLFPVVIDEFIAFGQVVDVKLLAVSVT
jgi:hypothetical protein